MTPMSRPKPGGLGRTQIFALALATGTAAALLAYTVLARGAAPKRIRSVAVVTATIDLPPRQVLSSSMLHVTIDPISSVPSGTFGTVTTLIGKVTSAPILAGQAVTASEVTTREETAGMAAQIAPTERAVSISLDAAGGAMGFLEPGDHVDVLATFGADGAQAVAKLIVSDASLLALSTHGTLGTNTDSPATSATLEVTPQGAQALALASARGRLTLALRSLGDHTVIPLPDLPSQVLASPNPPTPPVSPAPVRPLVPAPVSVPSVTSPPQVTILRGTQKTIVTVGE
jgi:pilus assembly protein CpaB